jgi:hypothetical protein
MAFIFGGNTGNTYEGIQRQRKVAEALLAESSKTPRNVGEGLAAIGNALAYKAIEKRAQKAEDKLRGDFNTQFSGVFGGPATSAPAYSAPMSEGDAVANDTMAALGNFGTLESQYGLPEGYLGRTYQIESGGNPTAQNPNSSAGGGFQFIDSTAKAYGLTDKNNLAASADAAARLARDNAAALRGVLGRDPTAAELYLAHQQGGGGAAALLGNPNAPAVDIVGADAVRLNGGNANMTAGEFANLWLGKFGGQPQGQAAPQMDVGTLAELAANPMASAGQKAVLEALIGQQMNAQDPMQQIELQRAQLELAQMQNPQAEVPKTLTERRALAEAAGLVAGTPEYQTYIATGNLTTPNGGAEFGLNPVLGRDAEGNIVVMQLGKDGTAVATKLPEGVTPDIGLKAFEAAQGTALGKGAGEAQIGAQVALPGAAGLAEQVSSQIDALKNDPYLDSMLGPIDSRLPNTSEDAARVQGMMDQLQGGAFLQARQLLKGGGAITDFEGQKAEAAFVRMNAAQKPEDFKAALDEFNYYVQQGVAKLEAQARGQAPTGGNGKAATHKFNPATGQIEQNGG